MNFTDQYKASLLVSKLVVKWDFQQCGMRDQQSLKSACAYAQSDQSLCKSLEYCMSVKLLTEHNLKFLTLKGGFKGSSESTFVEMPHCWKSHVMGQMIAPLGNKLRCRGPEPDTNMQIK